MRRFPLFLVAVLTAACSGGPDDAAAPEPAAAAAPAIAVDPSRFEIYATVSLSADLSHLSGRQRELIGVLIEAARIMDDLFWRQAYGDPAPLLASIEDPRARRFAEINYGPWDRLDGDRPFLTGVGPKPPGARFYPEDMTKAEFEAWDEPAKAGLYSMVRRDKDGALHLHPYSQEFKPELERAAALLRQAAELAEDAGFAHYLGLRADALLSDDYYESDLAWMDAKTNPIDLVYGPIETYEDQLYNYRAAFEAYVLVKDLEWSERLARFTSFLPELQRGLPVPDRYKTETPGTDSDLNAYDVVYYAGDCNAGTKTIAINLPNDERVQLAKGSRRLQLKNAMRAKFNRILVPIAETLIATDQRDHITFDAFFGNVMFHEVAHGLGIKNTIDGTGTVRQALKETASPLEEAKADILGLYMIGRLYQKGEIAEGQLMDNYVSFLADFFRAIRWGATSAHARANMTQFNFFAEQGAFTRDPESGLYRVNPDAMTTAIEALGRLILTLQGDGDYAGVTALLTEKGVVGPELQGDLDRLAAASIPFDLVFRQGPEVLGLE